jgi:hypothetical protein
MGRVRPALPIEHFRIAVTLDDIRSQAASTRVEVSLTAVNEPASPEGR